MTQIIQGTEFQYFIDIDYGMNKGFIAEGTESIVYKGVKCGGDLKYSCALKFKPLTRLKDFTEREYKILESMQICRSVVRVFDVITDLGDFTLQYKNIEITREKFFCVIEEYIDGESLQDYCINQWFTYNTEERVWKRNENKYEYREIVRFQNQIINFMINLCEIMKFVSNINYENGKINPNKPITLHCDIKPENIMVTKHGKELVLIDFGRSRIIREGNTFQHYSNPEKKIFTADYSKEQWQEVGKNNFYSYGTVGYAAPECFAESDGNGGTFPFTPQSANITNGCISVESDIFGFGATFYECFSIFRLCNKAFDNISDNNNSDDNFPDPKSPRFFNDFIEEQAEKEIKDGKTLTYCDRDFNGLSPVYHEKLEDIIRKCTHRRFKGFQDADNPSNEYYHNFYELQAEIEGARNIIPPLDRKTDPMVHQMVNFSLMFMNLGIGFLSFVLILIIFASPLAKSKWDILIDSYTNNQNNTLMTIADEMTGTIWKKSNYENFDTVLDFMYGGVPNDNVIDEDEAEILTSLLKTNISDSSRWADYINIIMQNCKTDELDNISEEIYMLNLPEKYESPGYSIAKAICYTNQADEIYDENKLTNAYNILLKYTGYTEYSQILSSLAVKLMTGRKIDTIADAEGVDREIVQDNLTSFIKSGGD